MSIHHALAVLTRGGHPVPLCWPTPGGLCGCGRGHRDHDIGKAPLLERGFQHLRPTEVEVLGWWRRWPSANIGILIEHAGVLVVDLDRPEAVSEAEAMRWPATYTVGRGAERRHLYFKRPADLRPSRTTKRGASRSIDILASGLVVAAGSRHQSGDLYVVRDDRPVAAAPPWAVAALRDRQGQNPAAVAAGIACADPAALRRVRAALPPAARAVLDAGAGVGARSEAEWKLLCASVLAGLSDADILSALLAVPWIAAMRPHADRWLAADLARAHNKLGSRRTATRRSPETNPWAWVPPTRSDRTW